MKYIATFCFAPWINKKGSSDWHTTEDMLACFTSSIEHIYQLYNKPVIYTDTLGKNILSELTDKCHFEVVYDKLYDEIPTHLWSYAKVLSYSMQREPYIHFDLDFILLKKLSTQHDILFQVYEHILGTNLHNVYNLGRLHQHYVVPKHFPTDRKTYDETLCPNLGILYMNDMAINKEYTQTSINFVKDNIEVLRGENKVHMCVVEQQILGIVLNRHKHIKVKTLLNDHKTEYPFNDQFVHFIGPYRDWETDRKSVV